jgi:hypothetical protein
MSILPECPKCGDEHDVLACAASGGTCDCCSAIYPTQEAQDAAVAALGDQPAPATIKVREQGLVVATWYYEIPTPAGMTLAQAHQHALDFVRSGEAIPYDAEYGEQQPDDDDEVVVQL